MEIDTLDIDLLTFISKRDNWETYHKYIVKAMCTKESWQLVTDFGEYFKVHTDAAEIGTDFSLWFRLDRHPGWKPEQHEHYARIIDNVLERELPDTDGLIDRLAGAARATEAKELADKYSRGEITYEDMLTKLNDGATAIVKASAKEPTIISLTLADLATVSSSERALYWRLEDLNKSIGPIRKGDLVIIGKRPEVGGTSFLVSEMSFMLEQLDNGGRAIIFNNEEAPDKVFSRMATAALDVDYRTLMGDPAKYDLEFDAWKDGREWDLCHDTNMSLHSIHKQLNEKDYDIIGINVLLKVGGTGQQEDHDKFQKLGEEMRKIAQKYGPVICIVQADPTAEGIKYVPADRIYKSKTALQGEADVQIMIGKDDAPGTEMFRYISVCKNKIPPAECTDMDKKHVKAEVNFDIATGRFTSRNYSSNSRFKKAK